MNNITILVVDDESRMRKLNWDKLQKDLGLNGCTICGYIKYHGALEFHHVNKDDKEYGPSSIMHHQYEKVKAEIKKCEIHNTKESSYGS